MRALFLVASLAAGAGSWTLREAITSRASAVTWQAGALILGALGLYVAVWIVRRLTRALGRALARWDGFEGNNPALTAALARVDRLLFWTGWLLLPLMACFIFGAPPTVTGYLLLALRLYLTAAVGLFVIRCSGLIVDVLEALGRRHASGRGLTRYFERLHPLLPTLRACLEYALWVALVSLVLVQIPSPFARRVAGWGPLLIEAIAIFFAGRVFIELGYLEIEHRMLPSEGLSDTDRRRRATMVPLVRSAFTYAAYFGTLVLMLSAIGFDVMPFLAGAGILGLVVGFGAQSMINDVVSGFFILFEHIYMVGDLIEVGGARGVVEAIEFRTTKIRDGDGRMHIIRNGDMKPVINYSKDYTMAIVSVDVAYDADLQRVFATLRQTGAVLNAASPDVLADTEIDGITAFGASGMTVRTSTRVRPGRHEAVAAALRLMIKETFDREAGGVPRKSLIPELRAVTETKPAKRGYGAT